MAEYMREMRRLVGNIPLMQCGASVIVENDRGEILLELRADYGRLGLPRRRGGAVRARGGCRRTGAAGGNRPDSR